MSEESNKKYKIEIPNCPPLLVGENYTEIKAWQVKFPYETKEMFWKNTSFETEHLNQPSDSKSWY